MGLSLGFMTAWKGWQPRVSLGESIRVLHLCIEDRIPIATSMLVHCSQTTLSNHNLIGFFDFFSLSCVSYLSLCYRCYRRHCPQYSVFDHMSYNPPINDCIFLLSANFSTTAICTIVACLNLLLMWMWIYSFAIRLVNDEELQDVFFVGQVVKCTVLSCKAKERKLKLSLKVSYAHRLHGCHLIFTSNSAGIIT